MLRILPKETPLESNRAGIKSAPKRATVQDVLPYCTPLSNVSGHLTHKDFWSLAVNCTISEPMLL